MGSFVLFSTKFNSNIYSFFCFATNSIQKLIQFSFFNKIQFKSWFNSLVSNKIQFKNIFKMLKLAVFNSSKYSFNKKWRVLNRATLSSHNSCSKSPNLENWYKRVQRSHGKDIPRKSRFKLDRVNCADSAYFIAETCKPLIEKCGGGHQVTWPKWSPTSGVISFRKIYGLYGLHML